MPDLTVNDQLLDAMISHQIGLMQVAAGIYGQLVSILNKSDDDIKQRIVARLPAQTEDNKSNRDKAVFLIALLIGTRKAAWDKIAVKLKNSMIDIAHNEPKFMRKTSIALSPVILALTGLLSVSEASQVVNTQPFEGRLLKQWIKDTQAADNKRINDAIKVGIAQGDSSQTIANRVVGTKAAKDADGILETTRLNIAALVRTATNHFANQARRLFLGANSVYKKEKYVAVLDNRTTPICRSLDNNIYPIGEGPIPPLHFNCRSTRIAYFDYLALSAQTLTPAMDKQLVLEFSGGGVTSRAKLPRSQRAKFDTFAGKRLKEIVGNEPQDISYAAFLKRQPVAFQIDVLGKTRQKLFAKGGLTLDRFVNRQGDQITLKELAKRESAAFAKAGITLGV